MQTSYIWATQNILEEEPGVLTFYGSSVNQVNDFYVHIGVPQAQYNQDITYKMQSATTNSISVISPLSNRKMFLSYHQPNFLYGTETMHINLVDTE